MFCSEAPYKGGASERTGHHRVLFLEHSEQQQNERLVRKMDITETRRTKWQALAHKRYRRMTYTAGDGEWLVMTMCPTLNCEHRHWAYHLFAEQWTAMLYLSEINAKGCNTTGGDRTCFGSSKHRIWRLK